MVGLMLGLDIGVAARFGEGWTPAQKLGGYSPRLWMLADDVIGNDGDAVSSWVSKEGNSYNFTQAEAAKKPLLKKGANGINGHNIIRGDGINDILTYLSANISNDSQGTVFAILRINASHVNNPIIFSSSDNSNAINQMSFKPYRDGTNPNMASYQINADTADHIRGSTSVLVDTVYLIMWKSSGTTYAFELNGTNQTLAAITGSNTGDWFGDVAGRDHFSLFAALTTAASNFAKCDLAELVLYPHNASASDIATFETYANRTYGVNFP